MLFSLFLFYCNFIVIITNPNIHKSLLSLVVRSSAEPKFLLEQWSKMNQIWLQNQIWSTNFYSTFYIYDYTMKTEYGNLATFIIYIFSLWQLKLSKINSFSIVFLISTFYKISRVKQRFLPTLKRCFDKLKEPFHH